MYTTLSGKEPAKALLDKAKAEIAEMEKKPHLVIVLVGDDPASEIYVRKKLEKAAAVGAEARLEKLPASASEEEVLILVNSLNEDGNVDGFIVQAPLPKHINYENVVEAIDPEKDVDGWTSASMGKMFLGIGNPFMPATPLAVMRMLEHYKVDLKGKEATVIGRSNVVGKPLAFMLLQKSATVTICHSKTKDLSLHTKHADVVVAAAGVPGLVKADMIKKGAYVIDVGTTRVDGKLKGDVEFDEVIKKAHCSPVPGGVGPMTVATLIGNLVQAAKS